MEIKEQSLKIIAGAVLIFFALCSLLFALPVEVIAASGDVGQVLQAFLEERYPWEKIEINNIKISGDMQGEYPEAIIVERGPLGKGVFSFMFGNESKVVVSADVRAFDAVVMTRWPFKKGYVLKTEDLYVSEMDVNKMPKNSEKDPDAVIGRALNKSVMANMPVTESMLEKSQTVEKGKRVVLLINSRGFNITAVGETREKGYVGMTVKAINLSSRKEVRGVLIDEQTVEVEL